MARLAASSAVVMTCITKCRRVKVSETRKID